ncbi:hypothetical protein P154DRAFT_139801 [Amniculicola lignicola CBS 123094]|uniref:Uncharacterized protein n=1 Tax=Amniculicola lignicola CBS 123094 TaxID=1392246 RepID=A0A6A5WNB1_9PLEO|nr:hypothetical protein P154DRAFT_139801 [Amniculicola lignicola CBS 123094]
MCMYTCANRYCGVFLLPGGFVGLWVFGESMGDILVCRLVYLDVVAGTQMCSESTARKLGRVVHVRIDTGAANNVNFGFFLLQVYAYASGTLCIMTGDDSYLR